MEVQKDSKFYQLFLTELRDSYWAENELVGFLKEQENAATSDDLAKSFHKHRAQTQEHVNRLEKVYQLLGEKSGGKVCEAMKGLVKEAREIVSETERDSMVRDAALIISSQKIEHYEIAAYGSLATLAKIIGLDEVEKLFLATLNEEKQIDKELTELAESFINYEASDE